MNKKFNRADMIQLVNENHKIFRRNKKAFRYMKKKEKNINIKGAMLFFAIWWAFIFCTIEIAYFN